MARKYRGVPASMKAAVLERDGYRCMIGLPTCEGFAVDPDHRCGRGMGGSPALDAFENLVAACRSCNGVKETLTGGARESVIKRGLRILRRGRSAEAILEEARKLPVVAPDGTVWRLNADGSREQRRAVAA